MRVPFGLLCVVSTGICVTLLYAVGLFLRSPPNTINIVATTLTTAGVMLWLMLPLHIAYTMAVDRASAAVLALRF